MELRPMWSSYAKMAGLPLKRAYLLVFVVLVWQCHICESGRGSSHSSHHSYSRPSYSRPSYSRPSYHPSPSRPSYHPSPSRPSYHPSYPSYPSFPSRPSYPSHPSFPSHPSTPSRPSQPAPSHPSFPSYPSFPSRPSHPSTPSHTPGPSPPNYGWNKGLIPSHPSSHPAPSTHPGQSKGNFGWNNGVTPSQPSSHPAPFTPGHGTHPGQSKGDYGWNKGLHPQPSAPQGTHPITKGGTWNTGTNPNAPTRPPNPNSIGWNKGVVASAATPRPPAAGWNIPGRPPVYQNHGSPAPQGPVNTGNVGFHPDVNRGVNSGVQRPGVGVNDHFNKQTTGQQQTGHPQGYPGSYPRQQYGPSHTASYPSNYQPGYAPGTYGYQPTHTTIINNNVHNYHPGYNTYHPVHTYSLPPVYYPAYHYSYHDHGSTSLGFYMGYQLARLNHPTYHYYGSHDYTYRPVYDHYTVYHYHHNAQSAPREREIKEDAIVMCVGDSGSVCPLNTHALCTTKGSIMCVAKPDLTVPCSDIRQTNCVRSTITCQDNTTPECRDKKKDEFAAINIPCLYTTKVLGNITYVNNTIVLQQPPEPPKNQNSSVAVSGPTSPVGGLQTSYPNATMPAQNTWNSESATTTPSSVPRRKRQAVQAPPEQQFCVTIVAQPEVRKNFTENEILYNDASNIFQKFAVKALGA